MEKNTLNIIRSTFICTGLYENVSYIEREKNTQIAKVWKFLVQWGTK